MAFIVKAPGAVISAEEVQGYVEARLSKHKWLTAGAYFVDAIPRTPSGKVIRRVLQTMRPDARSGSTKL